MKPKQVKRNPKWHLGKANKSGYRKWLKARRRIRKESNRYE